MLNNPIGWCSMSNVDILWEKLDAFMQQKNIELQKYNNTNYTPETTCHGEVVKPLLTYTSIVKNRPMEANGQVCHSTFLSMGKGTKIPPHIFKDVYNEGASIIEHFCAGRNHVVSNANEKFVKLEGSIIRLRYADGETCNWLAILKES